MGLADFGSRGSRATAADTKEQAGGASADIDLKATQRRSTGAGGDDPGDDDSDDDSGAGGNPFNHVGGQLPRPKSAKTPKLFADMNKLWNRLCLVPTNIHRPYQECKDVIRHGGLYHVATKVKRINEFMEREQQRVSITKILGDDFKSHLKLKYGLTSDDFVGMTMEELFPFLSAETVVADAARFYEEMENALKGTTVKTFTGVNPLNHMEFYYSQLRYIDDFRMLLSIMLTTNSQHVPSADSKEGGLVRLFCDYTDPVYARKVIASMNVRRWPNMGAFLGSYQASCLEHYDLSQTARQLPYDSYKTGTSKSDYRDRKRHEDEGAAVRDVRDDSRNSRRNPNFSPRSDPSSAPWDRARQVQFEKSKSKDRPWSKPQNRELSNTSAKVHDDDSHDPATGDESYFTRDSDYERDSEEEDRAWRRDTSERRQNLSQYGYPREDVDTEGSFETELSAMLGADRAAADDLGCLKKIMHGTCTNKNCTFSHTDAACAKTAKEIGGKCSSYLSPNSQPTNRPSISNVSQPTAILSRTQQGSRS
jgi:hypothetical protein